MINSHERARKHNTSYIENRKKIEVQGCQTLYDSLTETIHSIPGTVHKTRYCLYCDPLLYIKTRYCLYCDLLLCIKTHYCSTGFTLTVPVTVFCESDRSSQIARLLYYSIDATQQVTCNWSRRRTDAT